MNRTVRGAKQVHGKDPQLLVEKIIRERIFESRYWKENCFGLQVEKLLELGASLDHVGGVYANQRPTPFLCLVLRMLQIQPDEEIVMEFIQQEDFKYLRILGLLYYRLVCTPASKVYLVLEPFLRDRRKIRIRQRSGTYNLVHMDELVDILLRDDRIFDIILPRMASRMVLEETEDLEPREPLLSDFNEDDLEGLGGVEDEPSSQADTGYGKAEAELGPTGPTSPEVLSVEDTNALRAKLGLKPLH